MSMIIVCSFALLIQVISGQVIPYGPGMVAPNIAAAEMAAMAGAYGPGMPPLAPIPGTPYPAPPLALEAAVPVPSPCFGLTLAGLAANGGGFAVTSTSPLTPTGVTVLSENLLFEGPLAVTGQMPFLGVVALEGPLPVVGSGAVSYGCGNGDVGIISEDMPGPVPNFNGYPGPMGLNPGMAGPMGVNPAMGGPMGFNPGMAGPIGPNPAMAGYNGMGPRGPYGPMY